jgi:hypothetical protein
MDFRFRGKAGHAADIAPRKLLPTACDGGGMSQSSSGAPDWQLEGNAPLAYDTHIVDVFLQD